MFCIFVDVEFCSEAACEACELPATVAVTPVDVVGVVIVVAVPVTETVTF